MSKDAMKINRRGLGQSVAAAAGGLALTGIGAGPVMAQRSADKVREFCKNSSEDRKKYWESPLGTRYGDNLAVRLEEAENLIERLSRRIDRLEENQYDPYDR